MILGVATAMLLLGLTLYRPGAGVALALCLPMIHPGIGADASWLGVAGPGLVLSAAFSRAIVFPGSWEQNTISFVDLSVILWIGFLPVSVMIAESQEFGLMSAVRIVYMSLSFYFTTRLLCYSAGVSEFCRSFMVAMVVFGVFITGLALYLDESASEFVTRLTIGNTYIGLSNYITLALLCSLYVVFYMKATVRGTVRLMALISTPFLFYGMLLCNTRGVVVALVLAILFLLVRSITSRRLSRSIVLRGVVGISIAVVGAIMAAIAFPEAWLRMATKFSDMGDMGGEADIARLDLYSSAISMFSNNPLLGEGVGTFELVNRTYPHNLMLETMADMGLVGLVLIVIVVIGSLLVSIRYQSVNAMFITALLLLQLFESQVSLAFWMNKNLFVFVGMATALHLLHMGPRKPRKEGGKGRRRKRPLSSISNR